MCDAIVADCFNGGIAEDHFTLCGRVTIVGCFHICGQNTTQMGEFTDELSRQTSRFFTFRLGAFIALVTIAKTQSGKNLLCEQIEQFFYIDTDMVVDSAAVDC